MPIRDKKLLPPFTEAIVICAVFSCLALFVIPKVRAALADLLEGEPIPAMTQVLFMLGPVGIISIAVALGVGVSVGRLRSDYRWISKWAAVLTLIFSFTIAIGLLLPLMSG